MKLTSFFLIFAFSSSETLPKVLNVNDVSIIWESSTEDCFAKDVKGQFTLCCDRQCTKFNARDAGLRTDIELYSECSNDFFIAHERSYRFVLKKPFSLRNSIAIPIDLRDVCENDSTLLRTSFASSERFSLMKFISNQYSENPLIFFLFLGVFIGAIVVLFHEQSSHQASSPSKESLTRKKHMSANSSVFYQKYGISEFEIRNNQRLSKLG
eukprot:GDKJ01019875.1.p1 GENE.GDKJ01019875.1~~GDKJ01019875.1.p1  ORF type:complete len:211 (-),score=24.41 GDKJ01019875.1:99-731(-)